MNIFINYVNVGGLILVAILVAVIIVVLVFAVAVVASFIVFPYLFFSCCSATM